MQSLPVVTVFCPDNSVKTMVLRYDTNKEPLMFTCYCHQIMAQTKGEQSEIVATEKKAGLIAAQSFYDRSERVLASSPSGAL